MNQPPLFVTSLAGVVMAVMLASPSGIEAAAKSAPKSSPTGTCESTFKQTRPTLHTVTGVLQSHALVGGAGVLKRTASQPLPDGPARASPGGSQS